MVLALILLLLTKFEFFHLVFIQPNANLTNTTSEFPINPKQQPVFVAHTIPISHLNASNIRLSTLTLMKEVQNTISNKQFKNIQEAIPPSPIKQNPNPKPTLFFPSASFISAASIDLSSVTIAAHSHHSHTCSKCQTQNITCAILTDNKHLYDSSAIIVKEHLLYTTCFHQMKITIKHTQSLSKYQKLHLGFIKFILLNKQDKRTLLKKIKLSFNTNKSPNTWYF